MTLSAKQLAHSSRCRERLIEICRALPEVQRRLVRDDRSFFVPAYLGSKGWVAIRLDLNEVDWDTVNERTRPPGFSVNGATKVGRTH